jgi:hypothetical protein
MRSVEQEIQTMDQFLDERIQAEIFMWKPKSSFEGWYERNKFLIWIMGILLSIAGLIAKIVQ